MIKSYDEILDKLKKGEPFVFSRFGDGEWQCILGDTGANCDGHKYFPSLGERLKEIVLSASTYDLYMQKKATRDMGWNIRNFQRENNIDRQWGDADILHNASIEGRLGEFKDALGGINEIVIVGNQKVAKWIHTACSIFIPPKNCWLNYEDTRGACCSWANSGRKIFLFAASMASNVLIDDLHNMYDGKLTLIDVGSALDPYCSDVPIRKYHQQIIERESK